MKQHTNSEQTAKLIELGFEKPKTPIGYSYPAQSEKQQAYEASLGLGPYLATVDQIEFEYAYSIGELIELLPEVTCRSNNDDIHYYLTIYHDAMDWNIAYRDGYDELYHIVYDELIDAIYNMIVKLKEEGVYDDSITHSGIHTHTRIYIGFIP